MGNGIGIDIVDINRFRKKPYTENKTFYKNIFGDNELKYCLSKKDPYIHFAGKFAAKEALIKALGKKIGFKQISIVNQHDGSVRVKSDAIRDGIVMITISHEKDYAVAFVLVNKPSNSLMTR